MLKAVGLAILAVLLLVLALFIRALVTMYIWNATMPGLFHLPEVNLEQSLLLVLLGSCLAQPLFGGNSGD